MIARRQLISLRRANFPFKNLEMYFQAEQFYKVPRYNNSGMGFMVMRRTGLVQLGHNIWNLEFSDEDTSGAGDSSEDQGCGDEDKGDGASAKVDELVSQMTELNCDDK